MKRSCILILPLLATVALAEVRSVSIAALLDKPDAFAGKQIRVMGEVEKFEQRTSKAGNSYFVFKLVERNKKVSVFSRGRLDPPLKDGSRAEVTGTFKMENKVGSYVYKNEIETSPKGVKALKAD
jgi:hypothetical protein